MEVKSTKQNQPVVSGKIKRRTLLGGAIAAASIALVKSVSGQLVSALVPDPIKVPGTPPGSVGTRSAFEHLAKLPSDTSSRTPLQSLYGTITPSDLHFERSHNGVPLIDPSKYELVIHGMVDKPMGVKVEISTDAGENWFPANLQEPVLEKAHTYFRYLWNWNGNETEIMSRAIDETGYIQPTLQQLINARGADMGGCHLNPVTALIIKRGGEVLFKVEKFK